MFQEMGSNLASKSGVLLTAALVICAGLSLSVAQAQSPTLKPGDVAPEIKLAKLLQAATGQATGWKSLKGKVVVLEFWATWRSPCMPAITQLNELADKFKDQPIQFIAITDEDETGLKDKYDWDLPYNRAGSDVLVIALREQLCLELRKAKRPMEVLIVEKAEPAR